MRKLPALLAAGALALSLAGPATAAPVQNPQMGLWEIVCPAPVGTVVVVAKNVPGWSIEAAPGTPPILLRSASFNIYEGGVLVEGPFAWSAPSGLAGKLEGPCLLHLHGGSIATFDIRSDATWFQFPSW
ncbi:MAG: hypothetical protein A2V84_00080 [Chloroflexi bacterium RBG_16_70_13]|nr:MAG: hypothetical protein A2V84_00080 [Chloroflexi bacterium RBG_16_70_13]